MGKDKDIKYVPQWAQAVTLATACFLIGGLVGDCSHKMRNDARADLTETECMERYYLKEK